MTQLTMKSMNTNQFSLANRKQLADLLGNKYDGLRAKAKSRLAEKRQELHKTLMNEAAERKGALKVVEQIKVSRQRITDLEEELRRLGFAERYGGLSTSGCAATPLDRSIDTRINKELGTENDIDARFDSVQVAMMTVATLEDADKLLKSVSEIHK